MTSQRLGNWIQTYSGGQFWPLDPREEEINEVDIAHALSLTCRYGGHVREFYSVAEHCVLMSYAVPEEDALAALLHDATEAYVGDMVRPLKQMMPDYREVEYALFDVIAGRFGISYTLPDSVHDADTRILLDERAALMNPSAASWSVDGLEPLGVDILKWEPSAAEHFYLRRLNELV